MLHFVAGMFFVALGLWGVYAWWDSFGLVLRGLAPLGLILVGIVAAMSGFYRMGRIRDDIVGGGQDDDRAADWEADDWEARE